MNLETQFSFLERLHNGTWIARLSARRVGVDPSPIAREFRAPDHVQLFQDISAWYSHNFFPELTEQ